MTKKALDMIDEKIVELLQENARIAIKEIAAQVFLSSPAVTARIERLESKGIIKGYHAAVDSVNLGYKIKAFVNTEELDDFINNLQKFGKTSTQIVFSTPVEHRGLPVHSGFDA